MARLVYRFMMADTHTSPSCSALGAERGSRSYPGNGSGDVDLTLDSEEQGYMVLKSKAGVLHHQAMRAAEAAVALSQASG